MNDELKPCPFCGGFKATIEPVFIESFSTPRFCVICSDCGADSQVDLGQSGAEECWNTRPIEDKLRAENERLRTALEWYADVDHYLRGAPGENTPREFITPMWLCDVGERARKALEGGE